ncbi:LLM class flavin-dependent oxidoreductase [Nocardioides sp.]|uniref:LLM class flavin-dependent oxidoreductase n=1 Tax=Nocardioides sp. TaxID=35761 RepID=UPI0025FE84C2|nr:LLM class flavin-dependent oxidoreductase [Nocardioides sp.]
MAATTTPVTGIVFRPQLPPEDLRAVVEHAESAGLAELWLWEDCFLEGGLTTAAAALAWSERLVVGVGLLPVPLRNPALAAMEIATLARLFPDRLVVTLGHGVQEWMAQVGGAVDSPLTLLREHAAAVRSLLAGETVDTAGRYVRLDRVALDWPPATPPRLLVGGRGPRTLALAGEIADGVLLDSVADADAVRRARGLVGDAHVAVFSEVADAAQASDRVDELAAAGADTVILQAPGDAPDPRPLIDALASLP